MNAKIKIKFLKDLTAPQAVWSNRGDWGIFMDGWQETFFYAGLEIDPDEQYEEIDLRKLKLGEDFAIIEFVPETPNLH
jgi:hypothetical protein